MNKEQFIKIARKAGIAKHGLGWTCWESQLERFFELAILAERELCAQAAVDAIAFNGGSVQIESHVRKAIIEREIEAAHGIWPENSDCYGSDWTDRDGEYLK